MLCVLSGQLGRIEWHLHCARAGFRRGPMLLAAGCSSQQAPYALSKWYPLSSSVAGWMAVLPDAIAGDGQVLCAGHTIVPAMGHHWLCRM